MLGISIEISSSAMGLKIYLIVSGIKKYKLIIKKKKKKQDKIVLSAKSKLNSTEASISKTLADANISYDKFVLMNNVLKKYEDMK